MGSTAGTTAQGPIEELIRTLAGWRRAGQGLMIATDLDGTLAPIVDQPDAARADPAGVSALRTLASHGVVVCIASGRPLSEMERVLGHEHGFALVAEDGAVVALPDGRCERAEVSPKFLAALSDLESLARPFVERHPGASLERRSSCVAVHVRRVPEARRAAALSDLQDLARTAASRGIVTLDGRALLEIRPPIAGKAEALWAVCDEMAPGARVVFAGDDATDVEALALASRSGAAIWIASDEHPTPPDVPGLWVCTQPQWARALVDLAARV